MKKIILIVALFFCLFSFSQELESNESKIEKTFNTMPEPPGGIHAFRRYIGQTFRLPEVDKTTIGRVTTRFIVCNDGSICDVQVLNESPLNMGLGEEAKRILYKSGNWKPALKNEEAVSTSFVLPITIQILGVDVQEEPEPASKKD